MIVAFTGHRPDKLGGYKLPNDTYIKVCRSIDKALKELKPEKVITGMALGVDQWAAMIAYKLGIPYLAAIPFENQESNWPQKSQRTYQLLRKLAAEEVIVSDGSYSVDKMQTRNVWMVDNCNKLIAVWDGSAGGTSNCVKYAESIGKDIYYINPR
jgi:uncharacterized phage-like protein YoqJ